MHVGVCEDHDITAVAAVTAVRTAVGDELFPVKGNGTVAAVSGLAGNLDAIDKIAHVFILL